MMNNTFTIRKLLYTTALSLTITAMMPAIAEAAQHELNPNTVEGAKITVNDDNSSTAGEDFRITVGDDDIDDEGNPQNIVFQASNYGTGTTTVQNVDHIILNYNSDGGGTGAFSIKKC